MNSLSEKFDLQGLGWWHPPGIGPNQWSPWQEWAVARGPGWHSWRGSSMGCPSMGVPPVRWMLYFRQNPIKNWMIFSGHPHFRKLPEREHHKVEFQWTSIEFQRPSMDLVDLFHLLFASSYSCWMVLSVFFCWLVSNIEFPVRLAHVLVDPKGHWGHSDTEPKPWLLADRIDGCWIKGQLDPIGFSCDSVVSLFGNVDSGLIRKIRKHCRLWMHNSALDASQKRLPWPCQFNDMDCQQQLDPALDIIIEVQQLIAVRLIMVIFAETLKYSIASNSNSNDIKMHQVLWHSI